MPSYVQSGSQTINAPSTIVNFASAMSTLEYVVIWRCYDPVTLEDVGCVVDPDLYTLTGFTAVPDRDGLTITFKVSLKDEGTTKEVSDAETVYTPSTIVVFPRIMASADYVLLLRCYDPITLEDVGCDVDPGSYTIYGFTAVPQRTGLTLAYTATIKTLPIQLSGRALSRDFTAQRMWAEARRDVGPIGVLQFERLNLVNRAVNVISGLLLPLIANQYRTAASVAYVGGTIDLANLRLAIGPSDNRLTLGSTATIAVHPVSEEEMDVFRAGAAQNLTRIVWCLRDSMLTVKYGSGLTSPGTLTLRYVRVPWEVAQDADHPDLPDGLPMEMGIALLRHMIQRRANPGIATIEESVKDMSGMMQSFYQQLGLEISLEQAKSKVAQVL